jgi:uncharacterized phage infection (PIP) family protein YhgE
MRHWYYLTTGMLISMTACLIRERKRIMASKDLLDRLRKANDTVKRLAGQITELKQGDQEAANLADEINNTATTAIEDSGGGGSTGGGSGAQQNQQRSMSAQQAAAAVSGQRPSGG